MSALITSWRRVVNTLSSQDNPRGLSDFPNSPRTGKTHLRLLGGVLCLLNSGPTSRPLGATQSSPGTRPGNSHQEPPDKELQNNPKPFPSNHHCYYHSVFLEMERPRTISQGVDTSPPPHPPSFIPLPPLPKACKGADTVSQAGGGTHTSVPEIDSLSHLFTVKECRIPPGGKQSASRLLSPPRQRPR